MGSYGLNIFVNATAARESGALTILNQFVANIPDDNNRYIVFVDPSYERIETRNLRFIKVDTRNWQSRLNWDKKGMRNWASTNDIHPALIISLQNTPVHFPEQVPQLIYYHQPLPLSDVSWNPFKRSELTYFLYKNIYPFFVKRFLHENTRFVVQIRSMKEALVEKFHVHEDRISVMVPDIPQIPMEKTEHFDTRNYDLIFPATPLIYKNHKVLVKAIAILKKKYPETGKKIKIHFTFKAEDCPRIAKLIERLDATENFVLDGPIPYGTLQRHFREMGALLFPSYIESFGLPLLEAAAAGMPIIASDLSYAHDVLGNYEGASFIDYDNPEKWADEIEKRLLSLSRYNGYTMPDAKGWKDFFELAEKLAGQKNIRRE